jgi:hypothetical protein
MRRRRKRTKRRTNGDSESEILHHALHGSSSLVSYIKTRNEKRRNKSTFSRASIDPEVISVFQHPQGAFRGMEKRLQGRWEGRQARDQKKEAGIQGTMRTVVDHLLYRASRVDLHGEQVVEAVDLRSILRPFNTIGHITSKPDASSCDWEDNKGSTNFVKLLAKGVGQVVCWVGRLRSEIRTSAPVRARSDWRKD